MRRRMLLAAAAAAALGQGVGAGRAQPAWQPDRPLRLIVTFAPGGPADLFGRLFAEALGRELRQSVVVENRAGAGGVVGVEAAARAAPDGLTLVLGGSGALAIAPAMPTPLPYDPWRDLAHLTLVARVPEVLVVNATSGPADFAGLLAAARAQPGRMTFGSSGVGTITHLAGALLADAARLDLVHVPYRGAAPAVTDLLAGRFTFIIADVPVLLAHIRSGALRPLAVATGGRIGSLPDVPTTAELGLPSVVSDNWYGVSLPAAAPRAVVERLHAASVAALAVPELVREFARVEALSSPMSREDYATFLRAEQAKWAPIVRATGAASL